MDEKWIEIRSIDFSPGPIRTYSFSVNRANDFFANGILVHNSECPIPSPPLWRLWWYPGGPNPYISKTVKDPVTHAWVKEINASIGDTVEFRIIVKAAGSYELRYVNVYDFLPAGLELISADPKPISDDFVIFSDYKMHCLYKFHFYRWYYSSIGQGDSETIHIVARVVGPPCPVNISPPEHPLFALLEKQKNFTLPKPVRPTPPYPPCCCILRNVAAVVAKEVSSGCGNIVRTIRRADGANVRVGVFPGLTLVKGVFNTSSNRFEDYIEANVLDRVEFSILVYNSGRYILRGPVVIRDNLPSNLVYDNSACVSYGCGDIWTIPMPCEPKVDGSLLTWIFNRSLDPGYGIRITFFARVKEAGIGINRATVTADSLEASDTATVKGIPVIGPKISIEKYASLDPREGWYPAVTGYVGDRVYFLLVITNEGDVTLHDVTVEDQLPPFLDYNDDAIMSHARLMKIHSLAPPIDKNPLRWNLGELFPKEIVSIIFSANATGNGTGCNIARVRTDENVSDVD